PPPPSAALFPYTTLFRSTGGFTFTKIEDATAGRLIIGPRNSLTQLAWARQAERTFYGARCAAWSCPRSGRGNVRWSVCPWRHIRSEEHTSELQSQSNLVC